MFGRPVHLLAAAAVAAAASLFSISSASAGCYGCGGGYYQAPVAYSAPVVYSYSYAAPATYASGCGCGYASYGYAARPMYVVNQGPAYTAPVVVNAEPTPEVDYGYSYRRAPRYYSGYGYRTHRHWGDRAGYGRRHVGYGHRFGMKRYRYGAVVAPRIGMRHMGYGMRHMGMGMPRHMGMQRMMHRPQMHHAGPRMQMRRMPGMVHPK
jgi:hypothetical protein